MQHSLKWVREIVFRPIWILLFLLFATPEDLLAAGLYSITDLGTFGGSTSTANAINDLGQIVGSADLTNASPKWTHAFLYTNGMMVDLGTLGDYVNSFGTYSLSSAWGINSAGQIVGKSYTTAGRYHAFLYDQEQMTDLGVLAGSDQSEARSINASGQIVGFTEGPLFHAFLYDSGTMTDLNTLGGTESAALGINNAGQIVGDSWANTSGGSDIAFIYTNSTMFALGSLSNRPAIQAFAINDNGQVTGYTGTGGDSTTIFRGFLYSNGVFTDLGNLGGYLTNVVPLAINNKAQIVGNISGAATSSQAFLYSGGAVSLLDNLIDPASGWTLIHANGINNNGQIVGSGQNAAHATHAFLLTPRPSLQNIRLASGHAQFNLSGMTGVTYQVEYSLSLSPTNWLPLTNIILSASPTQITDASVAGGSRFYRVVQ
jgi:probable HAF family extracellular repeat protein